MCVCICIVVCDICFTRNAGSDDIATNCHESRGLLIVYPHEDKKGVGSLFLTCVSGIDRRTVCLAALALPLEISPITS